MAFSQPIWEVQSGGDDTNNGGGFATAASGFPTDGAATLGTSTAPIFSSASYNFVANDVGHYVFIKSGTNWLPGWYLITAVGSNKATLDAATGHVLLYDSSVSAAGAKSLSTTDGCATTASPTVATWGIDYSQGTGSRITFTDMVIGGTTTQFTSAGNPVGKNFVGNIISVTSGTGFTVQRVQISSTTGTTATCDKSLGTAASSGGNGRMGGCLATIGLAGSLVGTLNTAVFVKQASYSITSATTNVAGGCFSQTSGGCRFEGYQTRRSDMGTAPIFTASGIVTATIITLTGTTSHHLRNVTVDGASLTSIRCISTNAGFIEKVVAKNATNSGFASGGASQYWINCVATGCTTASAWSVSTTGHILLGCAAYSNSVTGFDFGAGSFIYCISANNSGATSDGYLTAAGTTSTFTNCVAYGNGRDGFRLGFSASRAFFINCVAETNTGWGFNSSTSGATDSVDQVLFKNCAHYNNTLGGINQPANVGEWFDSTVAYSASAFTNPGSNDFSLNKTSGGGLSLRGTGFPGAFLNSMGSTGYIDIGAVQAPYAVIGFSTGGNFGSFG